MASVFTHTYLTKFKRKSRLIDNRIWYVAGPKLQARKKGENGKRQERMRMAHEDREGHEQLFHIILLKGTMSRYFSIFLNN